MNWETHKDELARAVRDMSKVSECPHDLYRYPARFSPIFARKAIKLFSNPGDTVLDPFCGGGTTIVEALRLGRRAVGIDVSTLAAFVSRTKTTPLSLGDKQAIISWSENLRIAGPGFARTVTAKARRDYYFRNLPVQAQLFFTAIVNSLRQLNRRQSEFVRLILLATGQWALDCKLSVPSPSAMLSFFRAKLFTSLDRFEDFAAEAAANAGVPGRRLAGLRRVICAPSERCHAEPRFPKAWQPVRLVVTSPPYPGVHVLYHRWQVYGRRETPAPFWLANQRDGAGEAYYTLGARNEAMLTRYFRRLEAVFRSVRRVLDPNSRVVQLVAFSDPSWQLPAYLAAMAAAGFDELQQGRMQNDATNRVWRAVPGRKWYAATQSANSAGRELLLLHRPSVRQLN